MSRQYSILAPVLVGVLVFSPLAATGVGLQPGSLDGKSQATTAANATEVTSCRTIDEPGRYELTTDVTNESTETCIEITAEDVVFDGNGHTIDGGNASDGTGITAPDTVSRVRSNVTVTDVTVTNWQFGIEYTAFESGRIENVTVTDNEWGIELGTASITVANSTVSNNSWAGIQVADSAYGTAYDTRLVGNDLTDNRQGVRLLMTDESSVVVEGNTFRRNDDGLWVHSADDLTVTGNAFHENTDGIHVSSTDRHWEEECRDPPLAQMAVHGNAFVDNREYGIYSEASATVNATRNYWGATDGPSSPDDPDAPLTDPETGTLADGSGDAVSEGPQDGVSNVHFDGALSETPVTSA